jgi:hypothetical protein
MNNVTPWSVAIPFLFVVIGLVGLFMTPTQAEETHARAVAACKPFAFVENHKLDGRDYTVCLTIDGRQEVKEITK